MWKDSIVEEIRAAREKHASKFKHDLKAIYQDLKKQEQKSKKRFVTYTPKYIRSKKAA